MRVGRILATLRRERKAIDEAIAALENIGRPPSDNRKAAKLEKKRQAKCPLPCAPRVHSQPLEGKGNVIDFPTAKRAG